MSVFVGEIGLYVPKFSLSPTTQTQTLPSARNFKPHRSIPNPSFPSKSRLMPHRINLPPGQRGIAFRTMDGSNPEPQGNGALEHHQQQQQQQQQQQEEEELSPLFLRSSRFPSPTPPTGLQYTLNRLSKWLLAGLFTAVILWRHDAEALWAAMGTVLNTALSVVLKRLLNQQRPNSAISSGPGMPSSHAQSIFYTIVFVIWSLIQWLRVNALSLVLSILIFAGGSYLSWLRVSQQYHTMSQVGVGAAVGSGFAILWFWAWQAFVVHAFASFLWVKLVVVAGSLLFCLVFLLHVIRHWLTD